MMDIIHQKLFDIFDDYTDKREMWTGIGISITEIDTDIVKTKNFPSILVNSFKLVQL